MAIRCAAATLALGCITSAQGFPTGPRGWGLNATGQLGDGTTLNHVTPANVQGLPGALTVTAMAAGAGHSLALMSDGTVRSWGNSDTGQLGNGSTTDSSSPVVVTGLTSITAIACGYDHSLALKSDGTVRAWGSNAFGQLGDNTITDRPAPITVSGLTGVVAIACGGNHSIALKSDGTIRVWGWNFFGQLGDNSTTDRHLPVTVSGGLTGVAQISGGGLHTLIRKTDGTLRAWGFNENGQLGDGTIVNKSVPVLVQNVGTNIVSVAAGSLHSMALKADGTVKTWGSNSSGQLGDGTLVDKSVPVTAGFVGTVTGIWAGGGHSLVLRNDGTAQAVGANNDGQLGDGTTIDRPIPVTVTPLIGATKVACGLNHSLAIASINNCPADVWPLAAHNGQVNIDDLVCVITRWGNSGTPGTVAGDVNLSGVVGIDDVVAVIVTWGPCPP